MKKIIEFHSLHSGSKNINLTNIHPGLLDKNNVSFDFIPGSKNSGGFLTLWSSNLSPAKELLQVLVF